MAGDGLLQSNMEGMPDKFFDTGSPKTQSLLAYFALHPNQPIDRRRLAFLLWPHTTESAARRNLRQYLHRLRQVLEPLALNDLLQEVDGGRLIFKPGHALWIDVLEFEKQLAQVPQLLVETSDISPQVWPILDLYQGNLLPDIYDDWVMPLRDHWQQQYLALLQMLIQHALTQPAISQAIHLAERLLQADPLRESSHRLLMEYYYLNGDRARALQQYERCCQLLQAELDATPMPNTTALYRRLRDGEYAPTPAAAPDRPQGRTVQADTALPQPTPQSLTSILPPSIEPTAPSFISRQQEIAQLDQALLRVEQGQGQFILIQGESGVGKTRLVQAWSQTNIHRLNLFSGQCREFETMMSYHPLIEALQQGGSNIDWAWFDPPPPWLGSAAQILPELANRYPDLPPARATDRHHLSEGLGRFVLALVKNGARPLTLLLEDLHWADSATWQALVYLGSRCAEVSLLIIGTCQSELLSPEAQRILRSLQRRTSQISFIDLARFSPEETRQLASFLMDDLNLDRKLLSRLYQETEGNPFFIIETINAWFNPSAPDSWSAASRSWSGTKESVENTARLPAGVKSVIEARLDLLDETSRGVLAIAAAIGRTFNFRVLAAASDLPENEILDTLETWLARGLVIETSAGYDFSHDKIRAVVYEEMSRARRRIAHRQIAQALEEQIHDPDLSHPARLAHHYNLSDEPHKALPYLLKAGDMALAMRSYQEAREFGGQAIRLLRQMPSRDKQHREDWLDLNLQLATAYSFTGEIDRALPILQEAERLARAINDESRLARIFHRSAQLLWLRGQSRLADECARRLLRSAEELNDLALLHAALRMLGRVDIALSAYDDAIAYLLRYTKLDDSLHPPPDLPVIYGYLAVAYARVGSWQRAFDAGRRGVELAEAAHSSSALSVANMNLAFIYAERQHWSQCLEIARRLDPFCEEIGFSPYCFMARSLAGRAMTHLGDPREGIELLRQALTWAEKTDHRVFTYVAHLFFAEALLQNKQPDQAINHLQSIASLIEVADDRWAGAIMLRLRAEAQTHLPQPDWLAAESDLIEAADLLRQIRARPDLARTYLALRRLYDRAGQLPWSVDCHFRAITIFDELKMIDELREAQGYAADERQGAVVIPNLALRGPNQPDVS
jgi:DNA-binding SARP family transcriptional activator